MYKNIHSSAIYVQEVNYVQTTNHKETHGA